MGRQELAGTISEFIFRENENNADDFEKKLEMLRKKKKTFLLLLDNAVDLFLRRENESFGYHLRPEVEEVGTEEVVGADVLLKKHRNASIVNSVYTFTKKQMLNNPMNSPGSPFSGKKKKE